MALTLGTHCGFVTVAPTGSVTGNQTQTLDNFRWAMKHAAPANGTVTEMGVYVSASEAADIDLGLYSDAGAGEPELRQTVGTIAKGTGGGWKVLTGLSLAITSGTAYWLAAQCDNTATATAIEEDTSGGSGQARSAGGDASLPSDWGTSDLTWATRKFAVYALYSAGASQTAATRRRREFMSYAGLAAPALEAFGRIFTRSKSGLMVPQGA
jgi:hypothetical protein